MEILSTMLENGFTPSQEVQFNLDESMLVVKVPEYDRVFDVSVKNQIVPGISFSNSEVGIMAFCIEVFMFRLVCSNGLIANTLAGTSRFKHVSRKALDHFPDTLSQALEDSEHRQNQFLISSQTPVENPMSTIGMLNKQFQVGKREAETVEQAWRLEPGYTMFSVINAYTRAAKEQNLTAEETYKFEKVGGQILSMVKQ